jgi:MscS family membrane protein
VFIWLCLRIIDFVAIILEQRANKTEDQTDNQLILFFKDFFKVLIVINGVLLILHFAFNKNIGNLLTGLSIVGAAIALATRESLENLIASFIIFFDKPFTVGDTVKVQSFTGTVERIGLRSTRIRTAEKTYISVPNKQMVDSIVDNISLRTERKAEIKLELGLNITASKLLLLIDEIKKQIAGDYFISPSVFLTEIGKNAHIITIEYCASMEESLTDFNANREKVYLNILKLLEQNNVELAGAVKEVLVKS